MIGLQVDIFEDKDLDPVVTHVFWGETKTVALEVANAHKETDRFFKAAMTTANFQGIHLSIQKRWIKK